MGYRHLSVTVVCLAMLLGVACLEARTEEAFDLDDRMRLVQYLDPYGLATQFEYDALDRPIEIRSPRGKAKFGYDAVGRHVSTHDQVGLIQYDFDALNRLIQIRYEAEAEGRRLFAEAIRYTYDDHGQVQSVAYARAGQKTPYVVELFCDLRGRLVEAHIDGQPVRYRHEHTPDGMVTTRTLPDGTRSQLRNTPLGLPRAIEHYHPQSPIAFSSTAFQYKLGKGQMVMQERAGLQVQSHTVDLVNPHLETRGPRQGIDLSYNADGRLLSQRIDGHRRWFLNAPIGRDSGLVVELNGRGQPERAFFSAPGLSVEQRFGQSPTFFLEANRTPASAPLYVRLVDGRSMADEARGNAASALPRASVFPKRLAQLAPPVDYTKQGLGLVDAVTKLRAAGAHPNMDLDRIRLKLKGFNYGSAALSDIADMANSQASLGQKLLRHGLLGHTAEYWVKEKSQRFFEKSVGKGVGGEMVGLGFDLLRGRSLLSPEAVEHILDTGVGLAAGGLVTALGQPKLVPTAMELGAKLPDIPRKLLTPAAVQMGALSGRTGEARTGDFIYQASSALLRDNVPGFQQAYGDIFDTVSTGRERQHSAFATRRNRAYDDFQHAVLQGNRTVVSEMLQQNRHLRRAMMRAGYSEAHIANMTDALNDRQPHGALPGERIADVQAQLGGIDLTVPDTELPQLGQIQGVVFDPATQRLVVVGDGDQSLPPLDLGFLAVALIAAYSPNIPDPKFSLDPIDPSNPSGWQKAVYLPPELLRGTRFGQAMYQADLDLKLLAFGVSASYGPWATIPEDGMSVRGPVEVWLSNRYQPIHLGPRAALWPGFMSVPELTEQGWRSDASEPVRARQWVVVKEVVLKGAPHAFVFERVNMGVNARRQEISSAGELVDVDADDPISKAFAQQMTDNFDRVAESVPSFYQIRELAKAVALAKWLVKNQVEIDLSWAEDLVNQREDNVRQVSTLHWRHQRLHQTPFRNGDQVGIRTEQREVTVSGGIDLGMTATMKPDRKRTPALRQAVLKALGKTDAPTFEVPFEGQTLPSAVLPLNDAGRRAWAQRHRWDHDRIAYSVDGKGRITSGRDMLGQQETYAWTDDGKLSAITRTAANGWLSQLTFDGKRRIEERTTPSGQHMRWQEWPDGAAQLWVDSTLELKAQATRQGGARRLRLMYPRIGVVRELEFDDASRLVAVLRTTQGLNLPPETVRLDETDQDAPRRVESQAKEGQSSWEVKVSTRSSEHGERIVTAVVHGLTIELIFDAADRLAQAKMDPFPGVRLDFDEKTGFGQGALGPASFRVIHLTEGLTRLTSRQIRP